MFESEQGPRITARDLIDFSFKSSLMSRIFLQELPLRFRLGYILVIANCSSGFCSHSSTHQIRYILKCSLGHSLVQWDTSLVSFFHSHFCATAKCISTLFLPLLRPVPLGQQFVFQWPLGTQSLAAGGAGSLQPGHGCLPAPQAKRSIRHLAHRERQTSTCPRLYQRAATHHRVSTAFLLNVTPEIHTGSNA